MTDAQQELQSTGFNPGALKAEPKAAAEAYARIKAEATATEVRLQTMRRTLADSAPEVQQQLTMLAALRGELQKLESTVDTRSSSDYVSRYREFKYQETLFDLLSRQYEMARLDESREGALIQVVDVATAAEHKSKPKRAFIAVAAFLAVGLLLVISVLASHFWRQARTNPERAYKLTQLKQALGKR